MPRNDLKAYTTVLARLPQDLADQVKQYASQHRCTVSELIREGLEMRLEADVPGRSTGHHREPGTEVLHEVLQTLNTLVPMLRTAVQGTVRETMTEVLHEVLQADTSGLQPAEKVLHGHTSPPSPHATNRKGMTEVIHENTVAQQPTEEVLREVIPQDTADAPVSQYGAGPGSPARRPGQAWPGAGPYCDTGAGFDTTRFVVGDLCPQRHRYQDTAGSLRYVKGDQDCVTCHSLRSQRYNAKKRARRTAAAREG